MNAEAVSPNFEQEQHEPFMPDVFSDEESQSILYVASMLAPYLHVKGVEFEIETAQRELDEAVLNGADEQTVAELRHRRHYLEDLKAHIAGIRHEISPGEE